MAHKVYFLSQAWRAVSNVSAAREGLAPDVMSIKAALVYGRRCGVRGALSRPYLKKVAQIFR